jgi:hypothetical protein
MGRCVGVNKSNDPAWSGPSGSRAAPARRASVRDRRETHGRGRGRRRRSTAASRRERTPFAATTSPATRAPTRSKAAASDSAPLSWHLWRAGVHLVRQGCRHRFIHLQSFCKCLANVTIDGGPRGLLVADRGQSLLGTILIRPHASLSKPSIGHSPYRRLPP